VDAAFVASSLEERLMLPIVCFAKDWTEDPTSNNHVMRLLARQTPVLWLNSIATRAPSLGDKGDLEKIVRKLRSFTEGSREVAPGLHVATPIVLPLPASPAAREVNARILQAFVWAHRKKLGIDRFQLWSFLPAAERYVGMLGESLAVYYCTDEWSQFRGVDRTATVAMEQRLLRKVDLCFATSPTLVAAKATSGADVRLASHGVDRDHFARALDGDLATPPELAGVRGPVVGFFGLLEDWIDHELAAFCADARPDWTFVFIGKAKVDVSALAARKNVVLVDRRPYESLPAYCKHFTVALCHFRQNELTMHVNPIKLREYASAGVPVVATDIPGCHGYPEWCTVAGDREAFLGALDHWVASDTPAARRVRSEAMKAETWDARVSAIRDAVEDKLAEKRR
jgi:glycosyltransferase involved in cell wall biosynthesis